MTYVRNASNLVPLPPPGVPRRDLNGRVRGYGPHSMQWWYMSIADLIITNPGITQGAIAKHLGKTQAWISMVCSSDFFHRYLLERRRRIEGELDASVRTKLQRLADASLGSLLDKAEAGALTPAQTIDVATKTLNALGFGQSAPVAPVPVHVNVNSGNTMNVLVPVDNAVLRAAQARIRQNEAVLGGVLRPYRDAEEGRPARPSPLEAESIEVEAG